ncbi:MAG: penicillin-binding transpeptidase domain-containing protein [Eubacterium sp.]|nr:penicillin-binding transpeptidase domain-containing protein [Eubacterium sp.]
MALFIGLIAYMIYFQVFRSDELLNSPYNKRQDKVEESVIRGSILASDGSPLAQTQTAEDGTETRVYPYNGLFAHTVGYASYGGSGLESTHNNDLIHSHANIVTQVQNDLNDEKKQGDSIRTTLSVDLQQTAVDALGGNKGAVFVMNRDTGDVLVDWSNPGFNPNTIVEDWDALTNSDDGVFMNRATQGQYPPGSTFKIITALAYLRQYGTFDNFSYECTGSYEYAGYTITCANGEVHGTETFADAMANSCNCAFAYMSVNMIDKKNLRQAAEDLGFNQQIDLALPYVQSIFSLDSNTADQLTMQTAIGQGDTLATPMEMCMVAQAVANGGKMMKPNFISEIVSADGTVVSGSEEKEIGQVMTADQAEAIKDLLFGVVSKGTAYDLADLSCNVAGKTGTAEYGDIAEGRAHSWFTGFSNTGAGDIVVCVLVEDGGNGNAPATSVARAIFSAYFG